MTSHLQLAVALLLIALLAPARGEAMGDEVDYSAPYLTLENGELVTKYPALEHDTTTEAEVQVAELQDSERLQGSLGLRVAAIGALGAILAGLVFSMRRGARRRISRRS